MKLYLSLFCTLFSITPLLAMEGVEDVTDFIRGMERSEVSSPRPSTTHTIRVEVTATLDLGGPITVKRYFQPTDCPQAIVTELNTQKYGVKEINNLERIAGWVYWGQTLKSNDPVKGNEDKQLSHWVDNGQIFKLQCQAKTTRSIIDLYGPTGGFCLMQ